MTKASSPERRKETRRRRSGRVLVVILNTAEPISGKLEDVSSTGFRASHACMRLQSGDRVRFENADERGFATVLWNRIQAGRVESGFLVTSRLA